MAEPLIHPSIAGGWLSKTSNAPELGAAIDDALKLVDLDGRDAFFCRLAAAALIREDIQAQGFDAGDPELVQRLNDAVGAALAEVIPGRLAEILAGADRLAAEAETESTRITEEQQLRERFTAAGEEIHQRLKEAEAMRRGALIDAGALTLAVKKIRKEWGKGLGVDVSRLAELVDLSRPTLYEQAERVADSGRDLSRHSTAEVARLHLGYGFGGHEAVAEELWRRYPHLGAWYRAYEYLCRPGDDYDPWETSERRVPEAATALIKEYQRSVEKLAAGPLES